MAASVQDPMILGARIVRNAFVNVNKSTRAPMVRAPLSINRLMPLPRASRVGLFMRVI
jgi:hypothetical protein